MSHGNTSRRQGFTLVELLVVISIIGMLMALLLPAVNSARETARANTCRNNMRNVALALMQYENAKGVYPALANEVGNDGAMTPTYYYRPLVYMLLPYLERNDIYNIYVDTPATTIAADSHYLKILICPSDFQATGDPTSYVYNAGMPNTAGTGIGTDPVDTNDGNAKNNGVFFVNSQNGSGNSAYLTGNDGMATTVMVSENIDAGDWTDVALATVESRAGFTWHDVANPQGTTAMTPEPDVRINGRKGEGPPTGATDTSYARPSSNHFGGVNMAFADAHVTFINDTIDYIVYAQLMTPAGVNAGPISSGTKIAPASVRVDLPANVLDEKDY